MDTFKPNGSLVNWKFCPLNKNATYFRKPGFRPTCQYELLRSSKLKYLVPSNL